ncbi:MAG: hypothetical protein ACOCP8_06285 [archaeon]
MNYHENEMIEILGYEFDRNTGNYIMHPSINKIIKYVKEESGKYFKNPIITIEILEKTLTNNFNAKILKNKFVFNNSNDAHNAFEWIRSLPLMNKMVDNENEIIIGLKFKESYGTGIINKKSLANIDTNCLLCKMEVE